jgi:hypothetical protein
MAKCQTCGNEVDVVKALENLYPVHGAYEKNIQMLAIEEIIKLRKKVDDLAHQLATQSLTGLAIAKIKRKHR